MKLPPSTESASEPTKTSADSGKSKAARSAAKSKPRTKPSPSPVREAAKAPQAAQPSHGLSSPDLDTLLGGDIARELSALLEEIPADILEAEPLPSGSPASGNPSSRDTGSQPRSASEPEAHPEPASLDAPTPEPTAAPPASDAAVHVYVEPAMEALDPSLAEEIEVPERETDSRERSGSARPETTKESDAGPETATEVSAFGWSEPLSASDEGEAGAADDPSQGERFGLDLFSGLDLEADERQPPEPAPVELDLGGAAGDSLPEPPVEVPPEDAFGALDLEPRSDEQGSMDDTGASSAGEPSEGQAGGAEYGELDLDGWDEGGASTETSLSEISAPDALDPVPGEDVAHLREPDSPEHELPSPGVGPTPERSIEEDVPEIGVDLDGGWGGSLEGTAYADDPDAPAGAAVDLESPIESMSEAGHSDLELETDPPSAEPAPPSSPIGRIALTKGVPAPSGSYKTVAPRRRPKPRDRSGPSKTKTWLRVSFVVLANFLFVAALFGVGLGAFVSARTSGPIDFSIFSQERIEAALAAHAPSQALLVELSGAIVYDTRSGGQVLFVAGELDNSSHEDVSISDLSVRVSAARSGHVLAEADAVVGARPEAEDLWRLESDADVERLKARYRAEHRGPLPAQERAPFFVIFSRVPQDPHTLRIEATLAIVDASSSE